MKLFRGLNKKVISINFGSNQIKVIEGQHNKDKTTVTKAHTINLPSGIYDDGKIVDDVRLSSLIKEFIKEYDFNKDLQANVVVDSSTIITREINMPMVEDEEVASVLQYQLSDFLPINPEDYVVNHLNMGTIMTEDGERLRILIIAMPIGLVLSHLSLMQDSNLNPEILDFQGNAMAKLLSSSNLINDKYRVEGKTIASIDIGKNTTSVGIIKEGQMEVTRAIELGAEDVHKTISESFDITVKEAEERVMAIKDINVFNVDNEEDNRLLELTRRSIEAIMGSIQSVIRYHTSRNTENKVDLILLQGGYSKLNGICEIFSKNMDIETARLESLDNVKFDGDLSIFANAIGGLIRRDEVKR